jgi:hypothetical protein
MLTVPANYKIKSDAIAKQPVYVLEIIFAGGGNGTDGVNDIYFSTCDIANILNFPYPTLWFPFLKADSISGISQNVDPINGVSTIGTLTAKLTDYGGKVSDIIKAADSAGYGLRRQRIKVFLLFKGMDWADKVRIRTLQVDDLKLSKENEYTITASDVQTLLRKTVFNPVKTSLSAAISASGAVTVTVADAGSFKAGSSVNYGANGFIKIDSEIMRWTSSTGISFNIPAEGRGVLTTIAAAHAPGATVNEIIYLQENPITMALKIIESSGVAGTNGTHDIYPAKWGCNMASPSGVNEADWMQVGELLTGLSAQHLAGDGLKFEFVLDKGVEAKKFIEDSILKIIGAYGFVRADGSYSIRAYNDLANVSKENAVAWLTVDNIIKWGDLNYKYTVLANEVWIDYNEYPKLSGKYIQSSLFTEPVSLKKWGTAKLLKYVAQGIDPLSIFVSQLYQRFQRVMSRYSRPPMQISLTLMPKLHTLEIGDIVRVTLPIRDLITGASLDRAFEVLSTQLQTKTGEVDITCIAQPERASFWFGGVGVIVSVTISPAAASIPNGGTQQLVARTFDAGGIQVPIPAISWVASGNVTVSSTGLVTATGVGTGTVYAVSGTIKSNLSAIAVTAAANVNAISAVALFPSSILLAATQTQLATAIAQDVAGNQVNNKTFNWASSNPAAATVPIGPSISATITAVANGTTNIIATETVSGIVSPVCPVTVATPVTPTYTLPKIADAAYQVGTKITSMGPVNGPHVIPNGYNFVSGDYWFDGSVSLSLGSTCTINGTVRIFSMGVVTINGTVDGVGRGLAGDPQTHATSSYIYTSSQNATSQLWIGVGGVSPGNGFVGTGGIGGNVLIPFIPLRFLGGNVGISIPTTAPTLTPGPTATSDGTPTGQWLGITGIPTRLVGSGGGSGASYHSSNSSTVDTGSAGGNGGAGFAIVARGIYLTVGSVNLSGLNSGNGTLDADAYAHGAASGGGGGGGSFVALAEKAADVGSVVYGIYALSIDLTRVILSGGISGNPADYDSRSVSSKGINGSPGCYLTQPIG